MSLFEDEDVKKAIRASVSATEVVEIISPAKDVVTQALNVPYATPKKPVSMAAALLRSLNSPIPRKGGA
eukprot:8907741-Ditylum_brightwellii.AAC.1